MMSLLTILLLLTLILNTAVIAARNLPVSPHYNGQKITHPSIHLPRGFQSSKVNHPSTHLPANNQSVKAVHNSNQPYSGKPSSHWQRPAFTTNFVQLSVEEDMYVHQRYNRKITVKSPTFAGGGRKKRRLEERDDAHPPAASDASMRQVGRAGMTTSNTYIWLTKFKVGNSEEMNGYYDTGSSVTIMNRDAYKPSSTAVLTGDTLYVSYGDGTHSASDIYEDDVEIGGLKLRCTVARAQENFLSGDFERTNNVQGIIGYGLSYYIQASSLFEDMVQGNTLLEDSVTVTMATDQSAVMFGTIDPDVIATIKYTPVLMQINGPWWDSTSSFNGILPKLPTLFDTGTSLCYMPKNQAKGLFDMLGLTIQNGTASGDRSLMYGTMSCTKTLAPVSVQIGNIKEPFVFSPKLLKIQTDNDPSLCFLSIVGSDDPHTLLGARFLMNVHMIMDRGQYQLGFAQRLLGTDL